MTTLYKPTPITSVEQADALPDGAIVIGVETGERYMRLGDEWIGISEMGPRLAIDLDMGDSVQALVPVEAEQETRSTWAHIGRITEYQAPTGTACGAEHDERTGEPVAWETRYVTPWEEV